MGLTPSPSGETFSYSVYCDNGGMQNCRSGAKIKRTTPRATPMSPNLRAHAEQIIQNLKFEVFEYFVVQAERHLNYISRQAMAWYIKLKGLTAAAIISRLSA